MSIVTLGLEDLVVVDAHPADYDELLTDSQLQDLRVGLYRTGEAALRARSASSAALWMINTRLPDISGVALMRAVARRARRPSIFLVGDVYSPEEELAARTAGATSYFCKPASAAWLQGYRTRCRSPAVRAGPIFCEVREHS